MTFAFDTFISYARQDEEIAKRLHSELDDTGISCWLDRDQIGPTEYEFTQRIADGIDHSKTVLVIMSENYLSSHYCFQELVNALLTAPPESCVILPLLFDRSLSEHPICELTGGNSVLVSTSTWIEQISLWIRLQKHSSVPRNSTSFDRSVQNYLDHVKNGNFSHQSRSYAESVIRKYCQLEIFLHRINADEMHNVESGLQKIHDEIIHDASAPLHLKEATSARLAYVYSKLGKYEESLPHRRQIFDNSVLTRGRENFETIGLADALINTLARSGRVDEAIELAIDNLAVTVSHFSKTHALAIMAANTVGGILVDQGRYEEAACYLEPAYRVLDARTFSADSDEHLSIAMNYGFVCMRLENESLAWTVLSKVNDAYIRKFGKAHLDTAQVRIKLAECLLRMGKDEEADAMAQEVMVIFSKLDVTHPLRVFGSITALQCAHANGNEEGKESIFDQHISPLLATAHTLSAQVEQFLSGNAELRPFDALRFIRKINADDDDVDSDPTSLWLNIAWDGAANYGDPDCTLVIAAAQMNADTFTKLQRALRSRRLPIPEPADPELWFRKVCDLDAESSAAAFAIKMMDGAVPLITRQEKCRRVVENIYRLVPETDYFSNPMKFGRMPDKPL